MNAYIISALMAQLLALGVQLASKDKTRRDVALGINITIGIVLGIGGLINVLGNL